MQNLNLSNSKAVNLELTAKVLANGLNKKAVKKSVSKNKEVIVAVCLLSLIPIGVLIAKYIFKVDMFAY